MAGFAMYRVGDDAPLSRSRKRTWLMGKRKKSPLRAVPERVIKGGSSATGDGCYTYGVGTVEMVFRMREAIW